MPTIFGLDHIGKNDSLYRVQQSMKKVCKSLRGHTKNLIDFEKKNMLPITKVELKLHQDAKIVTLAEKESSKRSVK